VTHKKKTSFVLSLRWQQQGACWTLFGLAMALGWYLAPRPTDTHLGVPGGLAISFAMGIQNTVTSLFTPLTIRTSHVSGTVLDVGIGLGQCLRERNLNNMWKVKFHVPNFLAFWVGAVIGTVAYNHLGHNALLVNVAFGLIIGVVTLVVGTGISPLLLRSAFHLLSLSLDLQPRLTRRSDLVCCCWWWYSVCAEEGQGGGAA
jgi:uncharacterized membrane protein YoaK (UPF0700 family)